MNDPLPLIRSTRHFHEIPSTNDAAKELAASLPPDQLPALLLADRQTAGRGRGANRWFSDPRSLTFTLLLDPAAHGLSPRHEPRLALAAGLAVLGAVSEWTGAAPIGIRWPNDVEVAGKKIAGILTERVAPECGPRLALGIGLNVGTRFDDAPDDVLVLATSIAQFNTSFLTFDGRPTLLRQILARLATELLRLATDDPGLIADLNRFDLLRDRPTTIEQGPTLLHGHGRGIAPDGSLLLELPDGLRPIHGGRVLRAQA